MKMAASTAESSVARDDRPQPFWSGRPVLVSGATGFFGGRLVRRLVGLGAEVTCLVRPEARTHRLAALPVRLVVGGMGDPTLLESALRSPPIDTVFHLAGQPLVGAALASPIDTIQTNVIGTAQILEACRTSPAVKHVVVASSKNAYDSGLAPPFVETDALARRHPYDVSKACADMIAQMYAASYRLPVVISRCANLFGGGDVNFQRLVPGTIRSSLVGERSVVRSHGRCIRDYLYVEDAVDGHLRMVEELARTPELAGEAFNFSSPIRLSVIDAVFRILDAISCSLMPIVMSGGASEVEASFMSFDKATRVLGWVPCYGFDEALGPTVQWYREYFGATDGVADGTGHLRAGPRSPRIVPLP